jgi:hypothetical protein
VTDTGGGRGPVSHAPKLFTKRMYIICNILLPGIYCSTSQEW